MYGMASDSTIAKDALPGRKKQKDRITFLICCNADETEKFPFVFTGHTQRPRPFKKKDGREYGSDCSWSSRPWITSGLFFSWLHRFDKCIGKQPGKKVALLIDN